MKIRRASIEDLPQLVVLFEAYRAFYHKPSDFAGAHTFLEERLKNGDSEIFVAENNEELAGFVQLYPIFSSTRLKRYWLLNDLFVMADDRGKGYSKQLIEAAKNLCSQTNACGILLETDKTNSVGNRLYPACGFERYDHANFYEWTPPASI